MACFPRGLGLLLRLRFSTRLLASRLSPARSHHHFGTERERRGSSAEQLHATRGRLRQKAPSSPTVRTCGRKAIRREIRLLYFGRRAVVAVVWQGSLLHGRWPSRGSTGGSSRGDESMLLRLHHTSQAWAPGFEQVGLICSQLVLLDGVRGMAPVFYPTTDQSMTLETDECGPWYRKTPVSYPRAYFCQQSSLSEPSNNDPESLNHRHVYSTEARDSSLGARSPIRKE